MASTAGTIKDVVLEGKEKPFTYGKMHYKERLDFTNNTRVIINFDSIYRKYREYLQPYILTVELTDEQMDIYRYQPRKFCADFYNNIELWSMLLWINSMTSSTEFNKKIIKSFAQGISDRLMEIMTMEIDSLEENFIDVVSD